MCFEKELKVGKVVHSPELQSARNVNFHHLGAHATNAHARKLQTRATLAQRAHSLASTPFASRP